MLVEIPFFAAGINYFPGEIAALRVFEPRYLLLIGDSIVNSKNFLVGRNIEELGQIVSEVEILEHQDISNAEQLVVIECINLYKVKEITIENEYPLCKVNEHNDVGLPPDVYELNILENIYIDTKDIQSKKLSIMYLEIKYYLCSKLLRDIEIVLIETAMDRNGRNTSEAAKDLKLLRTTLIEKVKKYGL